MIPNTSYRLDLMGAAHAISEHQEREVNWYLINADQANNSHCLDEISFPIGAENSNM